MVSKDWRRGPSLWLLWAAIVVGAWVIYVASQSPRSPELERILQENCPGWIC